MQIIVDIPSSRTLRQLAIQVPLARIGEPWSPTVLGPNATAKGVYVIFQGDGVLYVGKTQRNKMNFGTRLRREFTESGSQGKHIYPKLVNQVMSHASPLLVACLPLAEIKSWWQCRGGSLNDEAITLVTEQLLIGAFSPRLQPEG